MINNWLKKKCPTRDWPTWQKAWFWGILGAFWISGVHFSYTNGNHTYFHTDSSTEGMTIFAANHYLDHGFFENYLLPTYPAFGHEPGGKKREQPFVYDHYLAGPDLTAALFMKVFGRDSLWAVRLIPHTLTVVALAWLCVEFALFLGSSAMGCILLSLLMLPRSLTVWSTCLYGHSHVMAFYVMMIAGILYLANRKKLTAKVAARRAWILGFATGLAQMFFDLDWVPVTFLSAASIILLLQPQLGWKQGKRILVGMILGGCAGQLYQLTLSSLYHGSATWVISNLIEWIKFRTGAQVVEGMTQGDLRLHRVLHEFNRQAYGSTGFTAFNLMGLSLTFLIVGYYGKVRTAAAFWRGFAAILLGYLAAAIWNIVMRQHSVAHIHFIPRHYISVYMTFVLIALPILYGLVVRSRSSTKMVNL